MRLLSSIRSWFASDFTTPICATFTTIVLMFLIAYSFKHAREDALASSTAIPLRIDGESTDTTPIVSVSRDDDTLTVTITLHAFGWKKVSDEPAEHRR